MVLSDPSKHLLRSLFLERYWYAMWFVRWLLISDERFFYYVYKEFILNNTIISQSPNHSSRLHLGFHPNSFPRSQLYFGLTSLYFRSCACGFIMIVRTSGTPKAKKKAHSLLRIFHRWDSSRTAQTILLPDTGNSVTSTH